ncbi:hypothetical protein QE152_g6058 [Popillia japonica]|uniref:Uncharacterized protein n=1 Tax=Popillia japonica TaxID=7064 RepID=A0AAW1MLD8_POPJA
MGFCTVSDLGWTGRNFVFNLEFFFLQIEKQKKKDAPPKGLKPLEATTSKCFVKNFSRKISTSNHVMSIFKRDLELLEDRPDQPVDILRLKYNLFIGVEFYNIRFGTQYNREQFLEIVFRDRSQDSGQSSIENSMSHSNTPLHNIVSQIN